MEVLIFSNQKGGVGKSSSTVNVASCLAKLGYKTLIIDLDSQGSSSIYLGYSPSNRPNVAPSVADTLYRNVHIKECIYNIEFTNIFLARGSTELGLLDMELAGRSEWYLEVSKIIKSIEGEYDFVLLDTPPSLNAVTINSLIAADHIIVTTPPVSLDANSIYLLIEEFSNIRTLAPMGMLAGVLFTRVRRYKTMEVHKKHLRKELGELVFNTEISESVTLPESAANSIDVLRYKPRSMAAKQYMTFTKELLVKLL